MIVPRSSGIKGLTVPKLKSVIANVRPDGFTFNIQFEFTAAAAASAFEGDVTTGVNSLVLPYMCLLKTVGMTCENSSSGELVPPENLHLLIQHGIAPNLNPGFQPAAGMGPLTTVPPIVMSDSQVLIINGNDNYKDLSSLGLAYTQLYLTLRGQTPVAYGVGDILNSFMTLRLERLIN